MGRVEDRREGVDRTAIRADGGGWCVDSTQGLLDIWELDPAGTVWDAFVVQN